MARHLRPRDVDAIVALIRGWTTDKLTWERICESVTGTMGISTTRQTLNAHPQIKAAYTATKNGLRVHGPGTPKPGSLAIAAQLLARQKSVIAELEARGTRYQEMFVRWQYNAYKYGVTQAQLDEELPRIDRERTDGLTSVELAKRFRKG